MQAEALKKKTRIITPIYELCVDLSGSDRTTTSTEVEDKAECKECPHKVNNLILRNEKAYWQSMHRRALEREEKLKEEKEELQAKLSLRENQLFGRKSEKTNKGNESTNKGKEDSGKEKRKRGHQFGTAGHGRIDYSHLPKKEEIIDLSEQEKHCMRCGFPHEEFPGTEDSEIIEIEVGPYRRVIKRKKYKPTCKCDDNPGIITAPAVGRVIPKGILGVSMWVMVLTEKYLYHTPTKRLLERLKSYGIKIAQGTITDGMKRLSCLFEPILEEIIARNLSEERWHADETGWSVFETVQNKVGYKWYLWVFISKSTVVYKLAPSRSSTVPMEHFKKAEEGILVVDRYSAYKVLLKAGKVMIAFCWAHVRRDFIGLALKWPKQEQWAFQWLEAIGQLYHINNVRVSLKKESIEYFDYDLKLREAIQEMEAKMERQLKEKNTHRACINAKSHNICL